MPYVLAADQFRVCAQSAAGRYRSVRRQEVSQDELTKEALLPCEARDRRASLRSAHPASYELVLKPFVEALADRERAWRIMAMASTLAGNLTLPGSVTNLIVAERARSLGVEPGFGACLRIGVPVMVLAIVAGTLLLMH